jgi:dephospho-CoA kinase
MEADHPNTQLVIGIAGRIGSGKSEVAHLLEKQFGFQYLRYSLVLAEWQKSDPDVKSQLQQVGWEVMSGPGQLELNRRLIQKIDPSQNCAVDGLRHPVDYDSLDQRFSSKFRLIFVETPDSVRFERLGSRYATREQFAHADMHPVESNIQSLKPLASAVVSGVLSHEQLASKLECVIRLFRSGETSPYW